MNFPRITTRHLCSLFALTEVIPAFGRTPEPIQPQPAPKKAPAQTKLRTQIEQIAAAAQGPVGAAVSIVEGGTSVTLHGEQQFPMQSTYKLPIGMAVLHQIDRGKINLNERLQITPPKPSPATQHHPVKYKHPHSAEMTVFQLLDAMITVSDNAACDLLLKRVGGPQKVTAYLRALGIQNIVVAASEKTMAQDEQVQQYRNWATPDAMLSLLRILQQGKSLSPSSRRLLLRLMVHTQTGPHRIKGLLPAGTIVAHKTGSSGTVNGFTRATNDVGLVTLPDGKHLAVAVFVSDTKADPATQEAVIAKIARAAWDSRTDLEAPNLYRSPLPLDTKPNRRYNNPKSNL